MPLSFLMQAVRHKDGLRGALNLIRQGGATLPDTTRTIWGMLNEQQCNVLRTMAELDRPEPESRLLDLLPGANFNRVNRALKILRAFHLIETRTQPEGDPLLGLHGPPSMRSDLKTLPSPVVQRLGRGVADRLHRAVQIREDFPDGNQAVSLTRYGLFSHVPQTRQGQTYITWR